MRCLNINQFNVGIKEGCIKDSIIIHPTNSCYGFGASINNPEAYKKIYEIKGRDLQKPFFITLSHLDEIKGIAEFDNRVYDYISKYPHIVFTFILQKSSQLPDYINPGFETIGVQIATGILRQICTYFDGPIFGTSANISGQDPIYTSEKIQYTFSNYEDILFIDGGDLKYSEPSTIIDLTQEIPQILRGTL